MLIERTDANGLATLTLNRPDKLNSLNIEMFELLAGHVADIARSTDTVGAVLLRGSGKCFSAGHDMKGILAGKRPRRVHLQSHVIEDLANLPQPLIVAAHGFCFTGGLELALAGDVILASESARFADTHAKWSLTPIWGMSQRLPRRVGQAKASEMMFTCRTYTGRQAEAMGLANLCFADDEFEAGVNDFMADVLAQSWFSHRGNKRLMLQTDGLPLGAGLAHEVYNHPGVGADMAERMSAFTKKD